MAAAPNILEAAPVTAATPAPAAGAPASGFDAILMMQGLAAGAGTLDAAQLEAGDTADLLATDESSDDEDPGEDLEASLAFLSALLTAPAAKSASQDSAGDFAAGSQSPGASEADLASVSKGLEGEAKAFLLGVDDKNPKSPDPLALTPVRPELLETRTPVGEGMQTLARAAELLTQVQRPAAAAAPEATVATHVRDPRWADDFSARVSLIVRAGESTASLQLTPVDLGPVEVNVTVKDSQATIHFGATQAETRALIEASLPRLRELLASQGFNLMDASVSSGFSQAGRQAATAAASSTDRADEAGASITEANPLRALGLLDVYA